jgi:hypothetical protein
MPESPFYLACWLKLRPQCASRSGWDTRKERDERPAVLLLLLLLLLLLWIPSEARFGALLLYLTGLSANMGFVKVNEPAFIIEGRVGGLLVGDDEEVIESMEGRTEEVSICARLKSRTLGEGDTGVREGVVGGAWFGE